ncbi:MAG: hypothetical protein ACJ73S_28690 [Mycobacteriales bacterium]
MKRRTRLLALLAAVPPLAAAACQGGAGTTPPTAEGRDSPGVSRAHVPGLDTVTDLAATGGGDVWAFDLLTTGGRAARWDGTRWTGTKLPASCRCEWWAAAAVAPGDVWLAGSDRTTPGPAYYLHWNGSRWQRYEGPSPGNAGYVMRYLTGSGSSVWAAGNPFGQPLNHPHATLQRWDGQQWLAASAPGLDAAGSHIWALAVPRPGDVWVGVDDTLLHGDGLNWHSLALPAPARDGVGGFAAYGDGDAWFSATCPAPRPCALWHWDGTAWKAVPVPTDLGTFAGDLTPDGAGGVWLGIDHTGLRIDHGRAGGAAGGLMHVLADGTVQAIPAPAPSAGALEPPKHNGDRVGQPWGDDVRTTLLGAVPGTSAVWFKQSHTVWAAKWGGEPGYDDSPDDTRTAGDTEMLLRHD